MFGCDQSAVACNLRPGVDRSIGGKLRHPRHARAAEQTQSHGCIRLTKWDALALAKLVKKGTPVEFVE